MSAVFLQCSSFFRRGWCQGSGITASLWWETVAHLLGWLPSFGIIGEGREGGMGRGAGVYRMGALKTLWDSTICCGNDLHPFSPFSYNRAPSHTVSASLLFCSCAPPPLSFSLWIFSCSGSGNHSEVNQLGSGATGLLWLPPSNKWLLVFSQLVLHVGSAPISLL